MPRRLVLHEEVDALRDERLTESAHLLDSLGDGRVDADAEIRRARERIAAVAEEGLPSSSAS